MIRGVMVASVLLAGCYSPSVEDCAYLCGFDGDACPTGTSCEDGFCRTPEAMSPCPGDLCGNHRTDVGEECDDNDDDTDACAQCKLATCGDGFVRRNDEECDDGNDLDDDGCVKCKWAYCGDNKIRTGVEQCDSTAGCNANCLSCISDTSRAGYGAHPDGHCYQRFVANVTFPDAQATCASEGGHLVTIQDQALRDALGSQFSLGTHTWIGLTQTTPTGNFMWVTGEPFVAAAAWQVFADDPGSDMCFGQASSGAWPDDGCTRTDNPHPAICEDDGWAVQKPYVDNRAYKVLYDAKTFDEAKAACEAISAGHSHLANLDDLRVQQFVDKLVFLDAWIGGAQTCTAWSAHSRTPMQCDARLAYVCGVD